MKRNLLVLTCLVLGVVFFASQTWAQCPEDPNDNGVCDTLYIEVWPGDEQPWGGFPHYVRFPIRVTNDIPTDTIDSIAGIVIPLCFTSTNAGANATIDIAKNNTNLYPFPDLENSIFRHMPGMDTLTATDRNFLMDISYGYLTWDTRELVLSGGTHFWMSLIPSGSPNPRFPGGSRVLTATMTFTIVDTTTICIDSCFWPPLGHLAFGRSDAITYIPRHFLPVCEKIYIIGGPPPYLGCPPDQEHHAEGHFSGFHFWAEDLDGVVTGISSEFVGAGVENVGLVNVAGLGTPSVTGEVEYDVTDHCQPGGSIYITAWDNFGQAGECRFDVVLSNSPPVMKLPDTLLVHAGNTASLETSALDANGDPVEIALDGFWYEPDSLQPPTNEPSYDGGNPGLFSWLTAEADTGAWICLISATDVCGAADVEQVTIRVGVPFCGEANGDGILDLGDLVFLIGFLYRGGQPPNPLCRADANCDGAGDVGDVVYLINYLFRFGQAPCVECCAGG